MGFDESNQPHKSVQDMSLTLPGTNPGGIRALQID